MRTSEAPLLRKKPSKYISDTYYSSQPMKMVGNRPALQVTFDMLKAGSQLFYSFDYLYRDMELPSTIWDLDFLSNGAQRNILGRTALDLFEIEPVWSEQKLTI